MGLLDQALRLRQAMGMVDSLVHVHQPKVVPEGSGQLKHFETLHEEGPPFDDWTHADICGHAWRILNGRRQARLASSAAAPRSPAPGAGFQPPPRLIRVLNAGSGMFAPLREQYCDGRGTDLGAQLRLEVTSVDRSARAYVAAFARHGWAPRGGAPQQCDVEELWRCFPRGVFDIVHVRNSLDHTVRPLQAMHELVRVTKPGGHILLWHWWNEHPEAWKGLTSGPHQWAFDLCPAEDVAAAVACAALAAGAESRGSGFPLLWNYAVAYNLTHELMGKAALVSARYEEDPLSLAKRGIAGENRYVVLELRRLHF